LPTGSAGWTTELTRTLAEPGVQGLRSGVLENAPATKLAQPKVLKSARINFYFNAHNFNYNVPLNLF
jgi:hypothetical protein